MELYFLGVAEQNPAERDLCVMTSRRVLYSSITFPYMSSRNFGQRPLFLGDGASFVSMRVLTQQGAVR